MHQIVPTILSKIVSIAVIAFFCWALSLATHSNNWIIFSVIESDSWNMMGAEFLNLYPLFDDNRSHHLNGTITIGLAKLLGIKNFLYEFNAIVLATLIYLIAYMAMRFFKQIASYSNLLRLFFVSFIFVNPAFIWLLIHFQLEELYLYLSVFGLFFCLISVNNSSIPVQIFLICFFSAVVSFAKITGPLFVFSFLLAYALVGIVEGHKLRIAYWMNVLSMSLLFVAGSIFHYKFFSITSGDMPSLGRFRGVLFEYLSCSGIVLLAVPLYLYQLAKEHVTREVIFFGAIISSGCVYLFLLALGWKSSIYHAAVPDGLFILYLCYFVARSKQDLTTLVSWWSSFPLMGLLIFVLPKAALYGIVTIAVVGSLIAWAFDRTNSRNKHLLGVSSFALVVSFFGYRYGFNISIMYPMAAVVMYLLISGQSKDFLKNSCYPVATVVCTIYMLKALILAYTAIYSGSTIFNLAHARPEALVQFANNSVAPEGQCHIAYLMVKQARFINPESKFRLDLDNCNSSHFYAHHDLPEMGHDDTATVVRSKVHVTDLRDTHLYAINSAVKQYPVGLFVLR